MKTKFYPFWQATAEVPIIDHKRGLSVAVFIEATDAAHAVERAVEIGIDFDDMDAYGNRWVPPDEREGTEWVGFDSPHVFEDGGCLYIHTIDGKAHKIIGTTLNSNIYEYEGIRK